MKRELAIGQFGSPLTRADAERRALTTLSDVAETIEAMEARGQVDLAVICGEDWPKAVHGNIEGLPVGTPDAFMGFPLLIYHAMPPRTAVVVPNPLSSLDP